MSSSRPTQNYLEQLLGQADGTFKALTASQFITAWNNYDRDGNGFIEGKELEKFLKDFILAEHGAQGKTISAEELQALKQRFLELHDANRDGKIDIKELAKLLPLDENFFLIFRYNVPLESGVDFIRIWKRFDKDFSGQIDVTELKEFLRQLIFLSKPRVEIDDGTLREYADTIMKIYDTTKTGKLKLSEMSKLLPVNATFLNAAIKKGSRRKLSGEDVKKVLKVYDKDGSGTIEGEELTGLVKDLLAYYCVEYDINDLEDTKKALLSSCDSNSDGKINLRELSMILTVMADETVGRHLKDPYSPL
ncbi:calbindin-32-like isoform X2 [Paramacrobiotus metropolitanus]|uniref:calbindin-32-like isoform X2 n=1 Tax=Paramacrobiotus metropolitanus TaxID=2943436 RepID=UPI0024458964|nr:calbindin-32-like isoform X2 [Paramacrobiotus metropolitanus]